MMLAAIAAASIAAISGDDLLLRCAPSVAPATLRAIIQVESQGTPLAINLNRGFKLLRQPASTEEASATAHWLLQNGYDFDAGLAQINSSNFARFSLDEQNVFDPCTNLGAAEAILNEAYSASLTEASSTPPVLRAISRYNTGSSRRGFSNGYVRKVLYATLNTKPIEKVFVPAITTPPIPVEDIGAPMQKAALPRLSTPPTTDAFRRPNSSDVFVQQDASDSNPPKARHERPHR